MTVWPALTLRFDFADASVDLDRLVLDQPLDLRARLLRDH